MLTKIKVYACYTVKIYKNKPVFFSKPGGGASLARRSWIRLWSRRGVERWPRKRKDGCSNPSRDTRKSKNR